MAITIVGTVRMGTANNGQDVTLTFDGTPAQNDVVFLFGGNSNDDGNEPFGPNTAGYTEIFASAGNGAVEGALGAWYKVLGASPDATVVGEGGGDAQDSVAYASFVLRGVNTSTPLDNTRTTAGPTASTNPDPAAIQTVTAGAWVLVSAISSAGDSAVTAPSGYINAANSSGVDTNAYDLAVATREIASPTTENPASWTSWVTGTWKTVTVAVRPASVTRTGTLAVSEGADTSAATGDYTPPPISGSSAVSEGNDTLAGVGDYTPIPISGSAAVSEGADTSAASGEFDVPVFTGTSAVSETVDTSAASGTFTTGPISGSSAVTEGDDTSAASGTFGSVRTGSSAVTEGNDTLAGVGDYTNLQFTGTSAVAEGADTSTASGTFQQVNTGTSTVAEGLDVSTASGTFTAGPISGSASVVETDDTSTATGDLAAPTFWRPNPVPYATAGVAYTPAPRGDSPLNPDEPPPW